jgi:hypothetical protein
MERSTFAITPARVLKRKPRGESAAAGMEVPLEHHEGAQDYRKLSTSMRLLPALSTTEYNSDF